MIDSSNNKGLKIIIRYCLMETGIETGIIEFINLPGETVVQTMFGNCLRHGQLKKKLLNAYILFTSMLITKHWKNKTSVNSPKRNLC